MQIRYHRNLALPTLSWLCEAQLPPTELIVHLGAGVEGADQFFVEGVWNGDFAAAGFDRTECFFGSGAVVRGDTVVFVPSAATTDWLYYQATPGRVVVSNSLPFLLASLGDSLDPHYRAYDSFNDSIVEGIDRYERHLVTTRGTVRRLLFRNLVVDGRGAAEVDKPLPPAFVCYRDYHDYLDCNYALMARNARATRRASQLQVFSTQSRGYDTTAVNAIAARHGIDKVFTCTKAKGKSGLANRDRGREQSDDGSEICRHLGLECIPIDRRRFEREFDEEYLYFASQHANQDANLLDINRHVNRPTILLTGILGEMWYMREHYDSRPVDYITPELRRWDLGGHGLTEARLSVGFIQVPVPYMGAQRRPDIFRISHSDEMAPWRLGTHYDRPIPRRIAEERGVPRDLFGQVKLASVVEFVLPRVPFSRPLREEYLAFLIENQLLRRWQARWLPLVRGINEAVAVHHLARYYAERGVSIMLRREFRLPRLWSALDGSIYCFAVNKRVRDYGDALRREPHRPQRRRERAS